VNGIGNECWYVSVHALVRIHVRLSPTLTIEDVATKALTNGHAQVDIQANSSNAHAGIILILGEQESVVMVMMVRVAGMAPRLGAARHGGRREVLFAVYRRGPVEKGRGARRELEMVRAFTLGLRAKNT